MIEALAIAGHRRWMAEKIVAGWRHAAVRDDSRRLHPSTRPYDELSEEEKQKDRNRPRGMRRTVTLAILTGCRYSTRAFRLEIPAIGADQELEIGFRLAVCTTCLGMERSPRSHEGSGPAIISGAVLAVASTDLMWGGGEFPPPQFEGSTHSGIMLSYLVS